MPKKLDYPRASLKHSLELAQVVKELGGSSDKTVCAEKMGKSASSGGFIDKIASTVKFGLITNKRGTLSVTQLYKDYYLSYTEEDKIENLKKVFFNIPAFKEIYEKYKNEKLPVNILEKALVKEFDIDEKVASRVGGYFVTGSKMVGLLNSDNTFNQIGDKKETDDVNEPQVKDDDNLKESFSHSENKSYGDNYTISIKGPAINQTIEVLEEDHLELVEAVLGIIRKKLDKIKNED